MHIDTFNSVVLSSVFVVSRPPIDVKDIIDHHNILHLERLIFRIDSLWKWIKIVSIAIAFENIGLQIHFPFHIFHYFHSCSYCCFFSNDPISCPLVSQLISIYVEGVTCRRGI